MCASHVEMMYVGRFGLGYAHDVFTFSCHMFMHFSCIHTILVFLIDINCVWYFSTCFSFSLSLSFFQLVALWHLNVNSLYLWTLFVPRHLLLLPLLILHPLMLGSVMIKPIRTFQKTFNNATFIWNTKSFYQIFSILTFPLSSIVGVGSHYVASRSLVIPWLYRSFTPICMDSTILYLILSLAFEVRALKSLRILYSRCYTY